MQFTLRISAVLFLALCAAAPLRAQTPFFRVLNPAGGGRGGLQLSTVSVFGGYTSRAFPPGARLLFSDHAWSADGQAGGSATTAWRKSGSRDMFSGAYTASYAASVNYPEWNALDHALTLNWGHKLSRHWDFGLAGGGSASSLAQFLFTPTLFSRLVEAPTTIEDLMAAVLNGVYTSDQIASLLTFGSVIESPARTLLYGDRVLNASLAATMSYAPSSRLRLHWTLSGGRSQGLRPGRGDQSLLREAFLPRTTGANAAMGVTWLLTPRSQLSVDASASRGFSYLQDSLVSVGSLTLGQRLGRRWFISLQGGAGVITPLRGGVYLPRGPQYTASGTLGYQRRSHGLAATHGRMISDAYGLGAWSTDTTSGSWSWRRPARAWSVFCSGGRQQLRGLQRMTLEGWLVRTGISRALSRGAATEISYAYLSNDARAAGLARNLAQHSVRWSFLWSSAGERPR